ncbi:hypothetical protein EVAR_57773_1 [Eumeta japonica]|uniref:Uncharacterized protein n=1 Tax=Eumeta variegata TaxID=151549 RepID=A0A4C1Y994_EUMVA|nr:hypothetical protein EVAR_57773_1 [Eumeta japonica]
MTLCRSVIILKDKNKTISKSLDYKLRLVCSDIFEVKVGVDSQSDDFDQLRSSESGRSIIPLPSRQISNREANKRLLKIRIQLHSNGLHGLQSNNLLMSWSRVGQRPPEYVVCAYAAWGPAPAPARALVGSIARR